LNPDEEVKMIAKYDTEYQAVKRNRSKCIVTGYDATLSNCVGLNVLLDNKREYAERYGWDFLCRTEQSFDKSRPAAFSKIAFILECLEKYDTVFWNDLDSIFTNFKCDVASILKDNEYIGMLDQGCEGLCSGNIMIKKNDYTKKWFASLSSLESWNNHNPPWEQRCINEKAKETNFEYIRRFEIYEFGTFYKESWWCIRPWQQGDFMLHASSWANGPLKITWQERINIFLRVYQKLIIK
jgi:hypothetical protein